MGEYRCRQTLGAIADMAQQEAVEGGQENTCDAVGQSVHIIMEKPERQGLNAQRNPWMIKRLFQSMHENAAEHRLLVERPRRRFESVLNK